MDLDFLSKHFHENHPAIIRYKKAMSKAFDSCFLKCYKELVDSQTELDTAAIENLENYLREVVTAAFGARNSSNNTDGKSDEREKKKRRLSPWMVYCSKRLKEEPSKASRLDKSSMSVYAEDWKKLKQDKCEYQLIVDETEKLNDFRSVKQVNKKRKTKELINDLKTICEELEENSVHTIVYYKYTNDGGSVVIGNSNEAETTIKDFEKKLPASLKQTLESHLLKAINAPNTSATPMEIPTDNLLKGLKGVILKKYQLTVQRKVEKVVGWFELYHDQHAKLKLQNWPTTVPLNFTNKKARFDLLTTNELHVLYRGFSTDDIQFVAKK